MNSTDCIVCGAGVARHWFTKTNQHGAYPVMHCRNCQSAFIWPRPELAEIEAFYGSAEYRAGEDSESPQARYERLIANEAAYPNSTVDARRIASTCRRFAHGDEFLDIGSGYGFFQSRCARCGLSRRVA